MPSKPAPGVALRPFRAVIRAIPTEVDGRYQGGFSITFCRRRPEAARAEALLRLARHGRRAATERKVTAASARGVCDSRAKGSKRTSFGNDDSRGSRALAGTLDFGTSLWERHAAGEIASTGDDNTGAGR